MSMKAALIVVLGGVVLVGACASPSPGPGDVCNTYDSDHPGACPSGYTCSSWLSNFYFSRHGGPICAASCLALVDAHEGEPCDPPFSAGPQSTVRRCVAGLFCSSSGCRAKLPVDAPCTPTSLDSMQFACDATVDLNSCATGLYCEIQDRKCVKP